MPSLVTLTMTANVPTNRKIDNLDNAEMWPVKFLMFSLKTVYLSRLSFIGFQ